MSSTFHDDFVELFESQFPRLARYLGRISGESDLGADLAQEAFVRLYRRGSLPDVPGAWLVTVATNLLRNDRTTRRRRLRLLPAERGPELMAPPTPSPAEAVDDADTRRSVRDALDRMPEREGRLLMLRAEGFSYKEIALALDLNEASVGTLLARAKRGFRDVYRGGPDAS